MNTSISSLAQCEKFFFQLVSMKNKLCVYFNYTATHMDYIMVKKWHGYEITLIKLLFIPKHRLYSKILL